MAGAVMIGLAVAGVIADPPAARAESPWAVALYAGQLGRPKNSDIPEFNRQDSYAVGFGVIWEFEKSPPYATWELEGVALQHFGEQHHQEFAASINVRWVLFPWDDYLDTSLAFGSGLSVATEVPEAEERDNPETGSARLLHYVMIELAFVIPGAPKWSLVGRLHHRSGILGLFDGVGRASNLYLGGLRYRF